MIHSLQNINALEFALNSAITARDSLEKQESDLRTRRLSAIADSIFQQWNTSAINVAQLRRIIEDEFKVSHTDQLFTRKEAHVSAS